MSAKVNSKMRGTSRAEPRGNSCGSASCEADTRKGRAGCLEVDGLTMPPEFSVRHSERFAS